MLALLIGAYVSTQQVKNVSASEGGNPAEVTDKVKQQLDEYQRQIEKRHQAMDQR